MIFAHLSVPSADPILGMAQQFAADPSPDKVDLGIGIYKDDTGKAPVLACVKDAEAWLLKNQDTKAYLSSAGNNVFTEATVALILGADNPHIKNGAVRAVQTPGGTGALRVAADFVKFCNPAPTVWTPDPTWTNHLSIFKASGWTQRAYPYYDRATGSVAFDTMLGALKAAKANDVILVHGCCHNPTGADLSLAQWKELAQLFQATGAIPLVDLAYQGFGEGLDEDAAGARELAKSCPEMLIASSYSKNFAMYRERVAALTLISSGATDAAIPYGHLLNVIRANYSMPPDHGAGVVAHVLTTPDLRRKWQKELSAMRDRVNGMRHKLKSLLTGTASERLRFLTAQRGMFTLLGVAPETAQRLRTDWHIHMPTSGRLNVAGLTDRNVAYVAKALNNMNW